MSFKKKSNTTSSFNKKNKREEIIDLRPINNFDKKAGDLTPSFLSQKLKSKTKPTILTKEELATLSWTVKEKKPQEKSSIWYFFGFLILLVLAIITIIQKNWLFLLFIILIGPIYLFLQKQEEQQYLIQISSAGVKLGKKLFLFKQIHGFGFLERDKEKFLVLETRTFAQKFITLPLSIDQEKISAFLSDYLPEKKYEDTLLSVIEDFFGF